MRTFKEVSARIIQMDEIFAKVMRDYNDGKIPEEVFNNIYSETWDKEVELFWVMGKSRIEAACIVATKFMSMSDEIQEG